MQAYKFSDTAVKIVARAEEKSKPKLPDGRPSVHAMLDTRQFLYNMYKQGNINQKKLDVLLAIADNNLELVFLLGADSICD